MASVGWLHLTDLHFGLPGQKWLWPTVREQFYRDLERLHAKSGPWDLVLFTGDLTQRGTKEEFDRLTETLGKLWDHLAKLGSKPALVTVPGNHDLQRPKVTPTVRALRNWHADADLREEFWASAANEYRAVAGDAFAAYEGFVKAHPLPEGFTVRQGVLPGDRSVSLERDGLKLALVGLNSAFLQLEGGDYQGRLDLDIRQLHAVCGDDPPDWLGTHHVALLLTHHPTTWLLPRAVVGFKADIAPPGRFVAHLFGHMHEGSTTSLSVSGSTPQRAVQGPSLFGLETWSDGAEQRIHGYMAARVTLDGMKGTFTLWPRMLQKNRTGAWQMAPDFSFELHEEAVVERFTWRSAEAATWWTGRTPPLDHASVKLPMKAVAGFSVEVGEPLAGTELLPLKALIELAIEMLAASYFEGDKASSVRHKTVLAKLALLIRGMDMPELESGAGEVLSSVLSPQLHKDALDEWLTEAFGLTYVQMKEVHRIAPVIQVARQYLSSAPSAEAGLLVSQLSELLRDCSLSSETVAALVSHFRAEHRTVGYVVLRVCHGELLPEAKWSDLLRRERDELAITGKVRPLWQLLCALRMWWSHSYSSMLHGPAVAAIEEALSELRGIIALNPDLDPGRESWRLATAMTFNRWFAFDFDADNVAIVIRLFGPIDSVTATELRVSGVIDGVIAKAAAAGELVIDMAGVDAVDSMGPYIISSLFKLTRRIRRDLRFRVINLNFQPREMIVLLHLHRVIECYDLSGERIV